MGYFREALIGTGWMGALRGIIRGVGLIKIVILARILTPADFGLFGIAAITLALMETFTETGVSLALVQQEEEIDEYVSTAWIISIVRGFVIGAAMLGFSKVIVSFFNQPEALKLLFIMAAIPVVRGFINPGVINFVKKLQFNKEFSLKVLPLMTDAVVTIIAAIMTKSAVAIIYGMLAAAITEVGLSFVIARIRPKLEFVKKKAAKLIDYGKWVTVGGMMSYLTEQFDDIIVGKVLGVTSLGIYQMAYKLSTLPSGEIAETLSKVSFPVYSKIAGDRKRLKKAVKKTTIVISAIALPASLLFILYPQVLIRAILGNQWLAAAVPLQLLAIYGLIRSISQAPSAALFASGRPDIVAKLRAARFIVMALLLFPLISKYQLVGAAIAVVVSSIVVLPLLWMSLRSTLRNNA